MYLIGLPYTGAYLVEVNDTIHASSSQAFIDGDKIRVVNKNPSFIDQESQDSQSSIRGVADIDRPDIEKQINSFRLPKYFDVPPFHCTPEEVLQLPIIDIDYHQKSTITVVIISFQTLLSTFFFPPSYDFAFLFAR